MKKAGDAGAEVVELFETQGVYRQCDRKRVQGVQYDEMDIGRYPD
jgi:hypothetical protein